jgi:hypothetical protein
MGRAGQLKKPSYRTRRSQLKEMNHDDGQYDAWNDVGMGIFWLLVIVVLILSAAALVKYLRS